MMRTAVSCIFALLLILPTAALAHPETGLLPDAVAEVEYKMVLDINPRDIATRNKLGTVLCRKNKLKEAEAQFAEVLKSAPQDFDAHDGMGLVKSKQRDFTAALAWFKKAVSLSVTDTMVNYNLGLTYEQLGRWREAESAYRQAYAVNERNLRKGLNVELETRNRKTIASALQAIAQKTQKNVSTRR